jgi:O-antigen/teichoic acid export membrane protein
MELFRILVVCVLVGIVASLANALFHLSSGKGDSRKMVRALTIRVGLSVGLFLLLIGAWAMGIISPHGIQP